MNIIKVKCLFPAGTLLFATQSIQNEEGNWLNKITSMTPLNRSIGDDKTYEQSGLTIEFSDDNRFFRTMMSGGNRFIAGKTVEILDEKDLLIYRGNVEKWEFQEGGFSISINDKLIGLENVIPAPLTKTDFPDLEDEADGDSIPLIFGNVSTGTGAVKCWKTETGKYLLAGHHCMSVEKVFTKDGLDVTANFALSNEGDAGSPDEFAFIIYTGTGTFSQSFIQADVKGKFIGDNLMDHPVYVLDDVFSKAPGMDLSPVNRENNISIMTERNYVFNGIVDGNKTVKEFLMEFVVSFDCDFYIDKENQVVISLIDWNKPDAVLTLNEKQISGFRLQELPETIRNKVIYQYRFDYTTGKYTRSPLFENKVSISNWGEFFQKNDSLNLACTHDHTTAYDVVQRYIYLLGDPLRKAQLDVPLSEIPNLDIADIIEIQHSGGIDDGLRKYQVRRIDIDFLTDSAELECTDITTLAGNLFFLAGDDYPELWAEVQEHHDRDLYRQYGYLCGDDGFFANGDEGKVLY